ncbi:MAG: carbon storage regulator CsrA [Clostridia bacterium]|jgi:carbon storage regulator
MLVFTRKAGQSFLIGEDIEIRIIEIQGEKIRIGVEAPQHISILRKELVEEVQKANQEAVAQSGTVTLEKLGDMIKGKNNP